MRKLFLTVLFSLVVLVAACGSVKDTKFTEANREKVIDKVLKSSDLTDEERQLATLALGRYQSEGKSLAGKSVGELIDEQRETLNEPGDAAIFYSQSAELHNNLGTSLDALGRHEEAIAEYDEAIRIDPDMAIPRNNKGNSLAALGRYEEALVSFDDAVRLDPKFAQPHKGKGNALYNLSRYEEAIAEYDKATELDPKYASAHHNKGVALHALGRSEEAKAEFARAHELDPSLEIPAEYK